VQVLLVPPAARHLPAVFGRDGCSPIDADAVARRFAALAAQLGAQGAPGGSAEWSPNRSSRWGSSRWRTPSARYPPVRGAMPATSTLFCSAALPASTPAASARAAGVRRILVHPLASVLSAFGIGVADRLAVRRASLRQVLDEAGLAAAHTALAGLEAAGAHGAHRPGR